jgi:hypothetical protein
MNIITNQVILTSGATASALYSTYDSGKIIYRDKIDTIIGIKHPGIVLGRDYWGTLWVIHNHYQIGHPQIVTFDEFAIGCRVFYDKRPVFYNRIEIIERAIYHWQNKREYSWLFNNCQHFVNKITQGKSYSETVVKVSDNAILAGGVLSLIGLFSGNKTLLNNGLAIAGVGATGKLLNKI